MKKEVGLSPDVTILDSFDGSCKKSLETNHPASINHLLREHLEEIGEKKK
jgi:hypothetical protein